MFDKCNARVSALLRVLQVDETFFSHMSMHDLFVAPTWHLKPDSELANWNVLLVDMANMTSAAWAPNHRPSLSDAA